MTYLPAVQLVRPEPVAGSILLLAEPLIVSNEAMGNSPSLAARPGGPVLFVMPPYGYGATSRMLLFPRQLRDGVPAFADESLREHLVVRPAVNRAIGGL